MIFLFPKKGALKRRHRPPGLLLQRPSSLFQSWGLSRRPHSLHLALGDLQQIFPGGVPKVGLNEHQGDVRGETKGTPCVRLGPHRSHPSHICTSGITARTPVARRWAEWIPFWLSRSLGFRQKDIFFQQGAFANRTPVATCLVFKLCLVGRPALQTFDIGVFAKLVWGQTVEIVWGKNLFGGNPLFVRKPENSSFQV